jgi:hypothetical protein
LGGDKPRPYNKTLVFKAKNYVFEEAIASAPKGELERGFLLLPPNWREVLKHLL